VGTDLDAANRVGFFSDLTPGAESLGTVVGGVNMTRTTVTGFDVDGLVTVNTSGAAPAAVLIDGRDVISAFSNGHSLLGLYSSSNFSRYGSFTAFRSRGTAAVPTAVADNDTLAEFAGHGFDGTDIVYDGVCSIKVDGAVSAGTVPIEYVWSTGTYTDRMLLRNNGRLQLLANITAVDTVTGTLQVTGGAGITGAVFAGTTLNNVQDCNFATDSTVRNVFVGAGNSVSSLVIGSSTVPSFNPSNINYPTDAPTLFRAAATTNNSTSGSARGSFYGYVNHTGDNESQAAYSGVFYANRTGSNQPGSDDDWAVGIHAAANRQGSTLTGSSVALNAYARAASTNVGTGEAIAVRGVAFATSTNIPTAIGVYGQAAGAAVNWAGYFDGDVYADGGLTTSFGFFSSSTRTAWTSSITPAQSYHTAVLTNTIPQGDFALDGVRISVNGTTSTTGDIYGRFDYLTASGSNAIASYLGHVIQMETSSSSVGIGELTGVRINAFDSAGARVTDGKGVHVEYVNAASKTGFATITACGVDVEAVETYESDLAPANGDTFGVRVQSVVAGCTTGFAYGVYIGNVSSAVGLAYGIYVASTTAENHFAGTVSSSSTNTGTVTVAGGVGIGENLYIGGELVPLGNSNDTTNVVIGLGASTAGLGGGVVVGNSAGVIGSDSVAIGHTTLADGVDSVAIGSGTYSTNTRAISIGSSINNTASRSIAMGYLTAVSGSELVAIGYNSYLASGAGGSVAIGPYAAVAATETIAIGRGASSAEQNMLQIGSNFVRVTVTGVVGSFYGTAGDLVSGGTSGAVGRIVRYDSGIGRVELAMETTANFVVAETLTNTNQIASTATCSSVTTSTYAGAVDFVRFNRGVEQVYWVNPHTFSNNITIAASTASTNSTSGALVVSGGVGIGGNVFAAGDIVAGTDPGSSSTIRAQGTGFFGGAASSQSTSAANGMRIGTDVNADPYVAWIRTASATDEKYGTHSSTTMISTCGW
jgi:hypothetical protein